MHSKEVHIGISTLFLQPDRNGGTETYLRELLRSWEFQRGQETWSVRITLFTSTCNHESFASLKNINRHQTSVSGKNRSKRVLYEQLVLPRIARKIDCDVLFFPGYLSPIRSKVPVVVAIHDAQYRDIPNLMPPLQRLTYRAIIPRAIRHASFITTISNFSKSRIIHHEKIDHRKVIVTPIGPKKLKHSKKVPDFGRPYLLTVSSSGPHKNRLALIQAFISAKARHDFPHALVLIGGAPVGEEKQFEKDEDIIFKGYVPDDELSTWYSGASGFILASTYEGVGLPVLEAMAHGVPVTCARTASLPEVAGKAALYFDPLQIQSISDAIGTLLTSRLTADHFRNEGLENLSRFSWTRCAEDTLNALQHAASLGRQKQNKNFNVITLCSSVDGGSCSTIQKCLRRLQFDVSTLIGLQADRYRLSSGSSVLKRCLMRLRLYVWYPVKILLRSFTLKKNTHCIVTSNTFFAGAIAAAISKLKKFKVIYVIYDLYPDALRVVREANGAKPFSRNLIERLSAQITAFTIRESSAVVYLGKFLRAHAEQSYGRARAGLVIPTGEDSSQFSPSTATISERKSLSICYVGLLGAMHEPLTLIECLKLSASTPELDKKLHIELAINGQNRDLVKRELKGLPITVGGSLGSEAFSRIGERFHIGLAVLGPRAATVSFPSKSYSYLAAGMAVIAICPQWSDLADLIRRHDAGWIINNSPFSSESELFGQHYDQRISAKRSDQELAREFSELLLHIQGNTDELHQKRRNALNAARNFYNISALSVGWESLLNTINSGSSSHERLNFADPQKRAVN